MPKTIDDYLPGQSPLPPSWKKDLLPPIHTYKELNEHESFNIQQAVQKYQFGGKKKWPVADFSFLKRLHRDMYGDVWAWAGEFRLSSQETNIGVDAGKIGTELSKACADCAYWLDHKTYSPAEIAVRYHHRIVLIHPFPNGNGRFSRFLANLVMLKIGQVALPWGGEDIARAGAARSEYIAALHEADEKKFSRLLTFAASQE
jgi:Fic-DOC domain mobile mystery protein B